MFSKKIDLISRSDFNIDKTKKSLDYIGKKVYSKGGGFIGIVKDIVLKNDIFIGVLIKGKSKLFIGKEFFASESKKAIVLKIEPVTNLVGRFVFDAHGKKIGKVVSLKRKSKSNNYSSIIIRKSIYKKPLEIFKKDIETANKSIILKKEIKKKSKKK